MNNFAKRTLRTLYVVFFALGLSTALFAFPVLKTQYEQTGHLGEIGALVAMLYLPYLYCFSSILLWKVFKGETNGMSNPVAANLVGAILVSAVIWFIGNLIWYFGKAVYSTYWTLV